MNTHSDVIVVGGGLAGLASAYTLAEQGKRVLLIEERDRLGGRVHSRPLRGQSVDFGGFIIYPWYREYHRFIELCGLKEALQRIPLKTIFYELDAPGTYTAYDDIKLPFSDTFKLWASMGPAALRTQMEWPDLKTFGDQTVNETVRSILRKAPAGLYERFIDIISQGYCYPSTADFQTAFMLPMVKETNVHGDIQTASYFPHGNAEFIQGMERVLRDLGVQIVLGESVIDVHALSVTTTQQTYSASQIVFAQCMSPEIASRIHPKLASGVEYTDFYTIVVEHEGDPVVNGHADWGAVFYLPQPYADIQPLTSIHLAQSYHAELSGLIMYNVRIQGHAREKEYSADELYGVIENQLNGLFPENASKKIVDMVHWKKLMPNSTVEFVRTIRALQGEKGYFYAGDYLGAPSMETALRTGIAAAEGVLKSS